MINKKSRRKTNKEHKGLMTTIKEIIMMINQEKTMMETMIGLKKIGPIKGLTTETITETITGMITGMTIGMTIGMIIVIIGMITKVIKTIAEIGEMKDMEEKEEETIMEMIEIGIEVIMMEEMMEGTIKENGMEEIVTITETKTEVAGITMEIDLTEVGEVVIINLIETMIEIKIRMVVAKPFGTQTKRKENLRTKIRMSYSFKRLLSKFMKILIIDKLVYDYENLFKENECFQVFFFLVIENK